MKKTVYCAAHASKSPAENRLETLSVKRNVWIQRDEVAQMQRYNINNNKSFDYFFRHK